MSRAETRIKKQLTDATIIDQSDERVLDTVGSESVERFATVRSERLAIRRLLKDAGTKQLYVNTLAGKMLVAASVAGSPGAFVTAVQDVVTGAGSNAQYEPGDAGDPVPAATIPSHNLKTLLSAVTTLYTDGKYYIDDLGVTGLYRPKTGVSTKNAIRRVMSLTDGGVIRLNSLAGRAILSIAELDAGTALIGDLTGAITAVTSASTTAATATVAFAKVPSASTRQAFQAALRKRSGSNRDVLVDNVGTPSAVDTAGLRYSHRRMVYDLLNDAGDRVVTTAGEAMAAVAALDSGTASVGDIVSAVQAAVA